MRLFSNKSQMMLKRGKNKKVAHEAIAKRVADVSCRLSSVIYYWTGTRQSASQSERVRSTIHLSGIY